MDRVRPEPAKCLSANGLGRLARRLPVVCRASAGRLTGHFEHASSTAIRSRKVYYV